MGADHPVSFCKDYQGGRSFYTGARQHRRRLSTPTLTTHLKGAISWAAGGSDPVYSDCGATVLKNYQQTKIGSPPNLQEPIGFDQLPDGRILQTDRLGLAAPARPGHGRHQGHRQLHDPGLPLDAAHLHQRRGRPLRPGGGQRTSPPTSGSTSTTRRRRSRTSSCPTARSSTQTTPNTTRAERGGVEDRVGPVRRLLPALAASSSSRTPTARAWTSRPSRRSSGSPTTARSAATSRATSTSTSTATCGSSRATTRPPAASTRAASARTTTRRPTSSRPCASPTPRAAPSR